MAIDERLRLKIHTKLTALLGSEEATALIEHIMPVPLTDVATKDDLRLMRADIDVFRAEIRTDMADLRTQMHQGFAAQTRWLMGYVTALSAIMLAVARLLF